MIICHHIIQKSEVVGIGPLMVARHPDHVQATIYQSRQLFFVLHLKNQSVKIESDWFAFDGVDGEQKKKNRDAYDQFRGQYDTAFAEIKELIEN
jgi:hypothetical protein